MTKKLVLFFALALIFIHVHAQKVYEFDATCKEAYTEIVKLKLDKGKELIDQARLNNSNNLIPDLLEGYIDFFILFFNEDPAEYSARKDNYTKRIAAFESGPANNPFYRYALALTYLQRAAVRIKFGERYSAGWDFKRANSLLKENRSKYKNFQLNNMLYGPIEVAIGTVPKGYKFFTSLLGLKGSISDGMQLMRNFLNSSDPLAKLFANEASFYYCYLMFYIENKPQEVMKFIQSKKLDLVNNHLFTYLAANLSINSKQTESAKTIILNRNKSPEYLQTAVWDFEMGYASIHHLELQKSIDYLTSYTNNFKGNFYVKDALQKISWAYYLLGDKENAEKYRQLCIRNGNTDTDADKKAYRDAKSGVWPLPLLLKARLLNDGGYQKDALAMLQGKTINDFPKVEDALEFTYRLARIYDDIGEDEKAIQNYKNAIKLGRQRQEYYAARAALQIGFIYEQQGQKALAISYYQQCLEMEDHEYKDSLDQRAKSGIARCKGE